MNKLLQIHIGFFFLFSSFAYANSNLISKIGLEEGISNNNITSIAQDSDGFLWFATENGLNRFDGNYFTTYFADSETPNSISGNSLNMVLADKDENVIWIATQHDGLSRFEKSTQTFVNYPINENLPNGTAYGGITALCLGNDNVLWIGTYHNGLKKLDKKTNIITHYDSNKVPALKHHQVWSVTDDLKGHVYIGHVNEGMSIISLKNNTVKHFSNDPLNLKSIPDNRINQIFIDSKNNVWLATRSGLGLYHPESDDFTVYKKEKNNPNSIIGNDISCITEINDKLWIGTYKGGISILDLNSNYLLPGKTKFKNIYANDLPNGLSHSSVRSLCHDSFGNVWIGTNGGGINFISHQESFFKTISYCPIKGNSNGLNSKTAWGLCYDNNNNLWVGTSGSGIDVFKGDKKIGSYSKELNNLPDNLLLSALADSEGNIWFGSEEIGIMLYDKQRDRFEKFEHKENKSRYNYVRCIFEDDKKNIWFGADAGILKYNLHTKKVDIIDGKDIGLYDNQIRSISQDKNGNIWVGSLINGLSIISSDLTLLQTLKLGNGFHSNRINYIYKDFSGKMWVATGSGISCFYDIDSFKYKTITKKDGLGDHFIRSVIEGAPGEMWMGTNSGLSRYCVNQEKVDNFGRYDAIPLGMFMDGSVTKSPDGVIYLGTQNGVCYFDSSKSPEDFIVPDAKITNFSIYDPRKLQGENTTNIPLSDKIKLKYNQNTFIVSFNVLDYALKDMIEYSYTLKGLDEMWYQTNGENQITFRNIPPGKYMFNVSSNIRNQDRTENIANLAIIITPPFWFSWWAKTIYALLIILIVVIISRFYKRKLDLENLLFWEKENHKKDQELNDEKLRFYTNIAHELRTPLTLIVGPLEDLLSDSSMDNKHSKKISLIHKSASRLANLTNQILEFRKRETSNRTLCVLFGDILPLLREITLKYKELNQNKDILLKLFVESKNTKLYYDVEVVTIIMDNLISNALKYTLSGTVNIILRDIVIDFKPYLEIEIKDSGLGIPKESLERIFDLYYQVKSKHQAFGTGIGLSLVKNLIQLHEGLIDVKSKENEGTSFYIRLSLDNTYPNAIHVEDKTQTEDKKNESKPILLVVEDNTDIREYIAESFNNSFEILEAENGQVGVELALEKIPDIIISDIMMPIMDGIHLTKTLKKDIRTSHIPIILLTAKDSLQAKTEGYSVGADSYITKPFSANLLHTRISNLLESREKIKSIFLAPTYAKSVIANTLGELDNEFIEKVVNMIEENLSSEQINIGYLADQMYMSHSTFYRKIKALTGLSATDFIRKIRIQHAKKMLASQKYSITEIAYKVGFGGLSSLRKAFKAELGISPSEFLKQEDEKLNTQE